MMRKLLLSLLCAVVAASGQDSDVESGSPLISPVFPTSRPILVDETFDWRPAFNESMRMLLVQHGLRFAFQPYTRKRLGGPFFRDWHQSVRSVHGWGDSDPWIINYVGHPIQGSASGFIQIQNDPSARGVEFGNTPEYWRSRLKALAWNAAYSTQFEIGPISESSLGNVGQRKGTSGYVDFVVTPAGGFALMIAEDWLDKRFIQRWEEGTRSLTKRTFLRIALNPGRSVANLMRGKGPWHREGRALVPATQSAPMGGL